MKKCRTCKKQCEGEFCSFNCAAQCMTKIGTYGKR